MMTTMTWIGNFRFAGFLIFMGATGLQRQKKFYVEASSFIFLCKQVKFYAEKSLFFTVSLMHHQRLYSVNWVELWTG